MNKKELVCYETDSSRIIGEAKKVVFPRLIKEVQDIVKGSDFDLVPRGGGSGFVGGCVPHGSIVIDMTKMNRVVNFKAAKNTVEVESGITIKELNDKLSGKNLEFPIIPSNQGISTIGGMIATNSIGSRSGRYGPMKDWIDEITLIDGRGEVVKIGKSDLNEVCGLEGITGVIISAVLRVIPQIYRTASIFQGVNLEETISIARRLKLEKEINSIEMYNPEISKLIGLPQRYHLIIGFDSDRGKISGNEYRLVSKSKHKVYSYLFRKGYIEVLDPKFFFDKIQDFAAYLESNQIPYFGYLDQGIIFPFFKQDDLEKRDEVIRFIQKIGGKFCVYGSGTKMKKYVEQFEKKVLQRVKLRHDPFCKFNKGKLIDLDSDARSATSVRSEGFARHLEPLDKKEIDTLRKFEKDMGRPIISPIPQRRPLFEPPPQDNTEQKSVPIVSKVITPNEKMQEFIKEVEVKERVALVSHTQIERPSVEQIKIAENSEIFDEIRDYEQTYNSEFSEERKKRIEDFAKNVAKDIHARKIDYELIHVPAKKQEIIADYNKKPDTPLHSVSIHSTIPNQNTNMGKQPVQTPGSIRDIMTNSYAKDKNPEIDKPNIANKDSDKTKASVDEIMRRGFGFGAKSSENKQETTR